MARKGSSGFSTSAHKIVNGGDITSSWVPNSKWLARGHYFQTNDVIEAQGFDGFPKVVGQAEFDAAVKASSFFAMRTYSAPTPEILNAYHDQLINGEWYIDCSTGGHQYGQGMYVFADYNGEHTPGFEEEISHYQELNTDKGSPYARQETMTLAPGAKIIEYSQLEREFSAYRKTQPQGTALEKSAIHDVVSDLGIRDRDRAKKYERALYLYSNGYKSNQIEELRGLRTSLGITNHDLAGWTKIKQAKKDAVRDSYFHDEGAYAAAMGYDAINAKGHGATGSYTVILNRTKLIILDPSKK